MYTGGAEMADEYWNAMVPELMVRDVAVSLAFYRVLGFAVRFQRSEPDFDRRGAGRDLGRRRPGVIAWRPLSDDRRGAGGIQGARHAMHVRLGGRPLSDDWGAPDAMILR